MSFVVGYILATLGLGLLLLGDVPLGKGKTLPARRARVAGAVLVAYLPLALLIPVLPDFGLRYLHASLTAVGMAVLVGVAAFVVYPHAFPPRPRPPRRAVAPAAPAPSPQGESAAPLLLTAADEGPVAWLEPQPEQPPLQPPPKGRRATQDRNPFDFS